MHFKYIYKLFKDVLENTYYITNVRNISEIYLGKYSFKFCQFCIFKIKKIRLKNIFLPNGGHNVNVYKLLYKNKVIKQMLYIVKCY